MRSPVAAEYAKAGHARRWAGLTALYIGALERGEVRWPNQDYRAALRAFFNATDIELGLHIDRSERLPDSASGAPAESSEIRATHTRACEYCGAQADRPALAATRS